VFIDFES